MRTHLQKMKMDKHRKGKYPFILLSISVAAYSNFHSVSVWLNKESGIDCFSVAWCCFKHESVRELNLIRLVCLGRDRR